MPDEGVLITSAAAFSLASLLRRGDRPGFVALWISNGTGRERADAPKVGWCWWGNRHTWLGIASCRTRSEVAAPHPARV